MVSGAAAVVPSFGFECESLELQPATAKNAKPDSEQTRQSVVDFISDSSMERTRFSGIDRYADPRNSASSLTEMYATE